MKASHGDHIRRATVFDVFLDMFPREMFVEGIMQSTDRNPVSGEMMYREEGLPMDDSDLLEGAEFDGLVDPNNSAILPRAVHQCNICEKIFVSFKGLQQHAVVHTNEKPFGCEICGKSFRFKSNLFEHRSVHAESPTQYVCPYCGKTCRLKGNLKKHIRTHVNTQEELDEAWKPFSSNRRAPADIPEDAIILRGDPYYASTSRPRKRKLGLGEDARVWTDKIRRGEILPNPGIEDKMHRLNYIMMQAEDEANSMEDFFRRLRAMPFERFDCPLCKSVFMSRMECAEHIESEHPMARVERPLFCEVCLKTFADRKSMEQHESYHRRVHMLLEDLEVVEPEILLPSSQVDDDDMDPMAHM